MQKATAGQAHFVSRKETNAVTKNRPEECGELGAFSGAFKCSLSSFINLFAQSPQENKACFVWISG